jgi:hypothetical protein
MVLEFLFGYWLGRESSRPRPPGQSEPITAAWVRTFLLTLFITMLALVVWAAFFFDDSLALVGAAVLAVLIVAWVVLSGPDKAKKS